MSNKIFLCGTVITEPAPLYISNNMQYYQCMVATKRLSQYEDNLPLVCNENQLHNVSKGQRITVSGEIRTFNTYRDGKNRVDVYMYATEFFAEGEGDADVVSIKGTICTPPRFKVTPKGKCISEFIVACNRTEQKTDYIPTIVWGRVAFILSETEVGTDIHAYGRMQSREYIKKLDDGTKETRVAYEVSAHKLTIISKGEDDKYEN